MYHSKLNSLKHEKHLKRIAALGGKAKGKLVKSSIERFMAAIRKDENTGCWIWTRNLSRGYGTFKVDGKRIPVKATRWAYEYFKKEKIFSSKIFVCHSCDVRACVNPDHLFLGSNRDNIEDAKNKKRFIHGENHHASKLSNKDVIQIKAMRATGSTLQKIADSFGVTKTTINRICKGKQRIHG